MTPKTTDEVIRARIAVLKACGGNQSHAAGKLGVSRGVIQDAIREAKIRGIDVAIAEQSPPVDPVKSRAAGDLIKLLRGQLADMERRTSFAENHREHILRLTPEPA